MNHRVAPIVAFSAFLSLWGTCALAQNTAGAPSPGLHSLEMSDQTIETLYKLKSGTDDATGTDGTDGAGNASDDSFGTPMGAKPSAQKSSAPAPKTNDPKPTSDTAPPAATKQDPNLQSHSLTFIPDGAEGQVQTQKSTPTDTPEKSGKEKENADPSDEKSSSQKAETDQSAIDTKIFTPPSKLKPWKKRELLYGLGADTAKIRDVLRVFESEPEYANPQTLMDVSALYAQVGDYKSAARYYYAANLRRAFDARRFPAANIPALDGGGWSESVGAWVAGSSTRMQNVTNDVRAWDERVPYRYHPGYRIAEDTLNDPLPDATSWPELLEQTRADFFKSLDQMAKGLASMGK